MMEVTVQDGNQDGHSISSDEQLLVQNSERGRFGGAFRDVLAALVACLGAVSMGLVLGFSNPALLDEDLLHVLNHDEEKTTWFGSLVAVGAILGGPIAAMFVGKLGRKTTMMLCTLPMGIGWFLIIYGSEYILVFCGRILTGIAMGMVSLAVPLYVAEVSSTERRGILGASFQLFVTVGILVVYALGMTLDWNWLALFCLAVNTMNILLLLLLPETPRWYIMHKERDKALESLGWLLNGSGKNLEEEYNEIEGNLALQSAEEFKIQDFSQPGIYKPMLICFGLMFFQQMSGINAVIFYSSTIFESAGFDKHPAIPTIIIGAVLVGATAVSCLLMDKAGRRVLLLLSGIVMTVSITILGVYYYLTKVDHVTANLSLMSLISVLVFVVFFSLGWGPIPWLVTAEIIPARARSVVNGLATCVNWVLAFVVTKEFSTMTHGMQDYGAFWFFGAFCLVGVIFVWFFVPETKGRSLEDLQEGFSVTT